MRGISKTCPERSRRIRRLFHGTVFLVLLGITSVVGGQWSVVSGQGPVVPDHSSLTTDHCSCAQLETLNSKLETLQAQLALWGDRGRVDLVEAIIYYENPAIPFLPRRDIAKAFVKVADRLQIPLLAGVAIADVETNFSNHLVGHHGEASLMQILPLPGRPSPAQLRSDPQLAISWALENCFSPAYHQALSDGKSPEEAIKIALKRYNSRDSYVEKVYNRYLWMKDFEAKGLYGWE